MRASTAPRCTHRRVLLGIVLLIAIAPALAISSFASAQVKVGPAIPAAGVGTDAAKNSPQCGPDGKLAYPYPGQAPCTRPLKKGESNGGATTMGVTAKTIKVVLVRGSRALQDSIRNAPGNPIPPLIDRATGRPDYLEQAFRDWDAVLAHSFNTWGRTIEFVVIDVTVPSDEAAQRADAFTVAEQKPFAVIAPFSGPVFAAELVAKKILVLGVGGVTNANAARQAPYRWPGDPDSNAAAVNAAQFAARQLRGETAKWSGDFTTKKRVFGALHSSTGIDWPYFANTAKKEGLEVARTVDYTAVSDASTATATYQEEAPSLVAKLKDSGVTTVVLFADYLMKQQVFKAADLLDYHPEWVFTGYASDDIEATARFLNATSPAQMKHVFGIGSIPPYVAGIDDPIEHWFDWYWGKNKGVYSVMPVGPLATLHEGVSLAGPRLTPARFQQALFSMPASGGAASNQVESFMAGFGRTTGLPYDEYSQGGLDFSVIWWNPTEVGKGKLLLDDGTGRFMYIDHAKRYHAGQWVKGEPKLFDTTNSISQFNELPASDAVPDYPCKGCPSTRS
jgi:hypothetical protein